MPKQKTDDLLKLVASLNGRETHFRLFVKRNQQAEADILFLQLFNILERTGEYDEAYLLKRIAGIKKSQLSNLKAHLYKQLLTSLRLLNRNKMKRSPSARASITPVFCTIRGSTDSRSTFSTRPKNAPWRSSRIRSPWRPPQFEKLIEGQYITRSIEGRAEELSLECENLTTKIADTNAFSNLSLRLYGLYLAAAW